jgi:peptidoglycan/LPS O-acetylase OafA/YrhL
MTTTLGMRAGSATEASATEPPGRRPAAPARPGRRPAWQRRPLGYLPALDGVRALAVMLVVAYHLGYSRIAGGYIGVEVFFVLSGWLVCAVLVNEHHRTGGIRLTRFWLRRARRLLPALVATIAGTFAVASVAQPERLAELRSQAVAALAYHLNWRLVFDRQSYFETASGPSALEHLWSLSIEEQFYLAFPLICGLLLVWWRPRRAVAWVLAAAGAATVLRFALVTPGDDPSRAYFGTDTRASGLLLGVALGLFWTPNRLRPHDDPRFVAVLDAIAVGALAVLGWYACGLDERAPTAFRGGFTAAELASLALIAVVVYPAPTRTVAVLSARPLRWVGQRSYGIYLIHWPVIVFLSAAPGEQPDGPVAVATQVALILGLAALSYRVVEQPIRRHGVAASARAAAGHVAAFVEGRPMVALTTAAACIVAFGATVGVTREVVTASTPVADQPTAVVIDPAVAGGDAAATPTTTAATSAPTTTAPATSPTTPTTSAPATTAPTTAPAAAAAYAPTTAIGDSVLVGAAPVLAARIGPALGVDAAIGRQMDEADELVAAIAARGTLGQVVLLHLGNNGPFSAEQIDAVFAAIGPERRVLLVNVLVPRRWEGEVNDQLAAAAARHPNAVLVDWRTLATSEGGLTREDGYHLTAHGAERYADLVVGQVPRA